MGAEIVNQAAWQTGPKVKPLEVGPGPAQDKPAADEVVIKAAYVAINPSEWKVFPQRNLLYLTFRLTRNLDPRYSPLAT